MSSFKSVLFIGFILCLSAAGRAAATPILVGTFSGVITSGGEGVVSGLAFQTGDRYLAYYSVIEPNAGNGYGYQEYAWTGGSDYTYLYLRFVNLTTGLRTNNSTPEDIGVGGRSDDGWDSGRLGFHFTYSGVDQAWIELRIVDGAITGDIQLQTTQQANRVFGKVESGEIAVMNTPEPATLFGLGLGLAAMGTRRRADGRSTRGDRRSVSASSNS